MPLGWTEFPLGKKKKKKIHWKMLMTLFNNTLLACRNEAANVFQLLDGVGNETGKLQKKAMYAVNN